MRTLLVGWLLLVLTVAAVATVSANWYEYNVLSSERGVRLEDGWEPYMLTPQGEGATLVFVRRPFVRRLR